MTKRILVVEDQEDLRGILRVLLTGSGYEMLEASDGREGAAKAKAERPDLILMDIQLPILDGYEATRQIKSDPNLKATPIIAVSSFAMKGDEEKARASGCDHYVTKPYSARELRARVKAHLRRGIAHTSDVYRFGDAELDFTRCELRRGDKVVELSALEFKLLAAFVRRSGCLLTRRQLLDEVWGHGTHVTDRVVDNQVTNLRRKIEPEPERPRYLVALRGLGYRFDGEGLTDE